MKDPKLSEKYIAARESLPEELWPTFDQLAEHYRFAAMLHNKAPFVSYFILAEMVQAGWRPTGQPIGKWVKDTLNNSK